MADESGRPIALMLDQTIRAFGRWEGDADDVIAELDAVGYVIVPKVPTPAMVKAAAERTHNVVCAASLVVDGSKPTEKYWDAAGIYGEMIEARPK